MVDELDRKILNMLIADGRQSNRIMVKKLGEEGIRISERGLGKRIARLEKERIITGYTAMVDMKKVNMGIPRLITVKLSSPKNFVQRLDDMKQHLGNNNFFDKQRISCSIYSTNVGYSSTAVSTPKEKVRK
ncbi:MAG TPA: hypothetical protein ENH95_08100 [Nitrosopumilus sp.]|nr:hypothetical protein [Nitrosopumilus sp.]